MENLSYTVIDPINYQETVMLLKPTKTGCIINGVHFDHQQLGEFGSLMIALSDMDADSVGELIDGYGLSCSELRDKLQAIGNIL